MIFFIISPGRWVWILVYVVSWESDHTHWVLADLKQAIASTNIQSPSLRIHIPVHTIMTYCTYILNFSYLASNKAKKDSFHTGVLAYVGPFDEVNKL